MNYSIDLTTTNGQSTFESGFSASDDFTAMQELIDGGMTVKEAAEAQAEGSLETPYDDTEFDAYWNVEEAKDAYYAAFIAELSAGNGLDWLTDAVRNEVGEIEYTEDIEDIRVVKIEDIYFAITAAGDMDDVVLVAVGTDLTAIRTSVNDYKEFA